MTPGLSPLKPLSNFLKLLLMRKTIWIILFLLALVTVLVAEYLKNESLRFISKPLLMLLLGIYFLSETKNKSTILKAWIILALFFSWIGDILLMFEHQNKNYFLFGLSAFFLAQIFYIVFFHNIRMRENIRGNALLLLVVVVYYYVLIFLLNPYLHELSLPVRIYGVVLSFMLMLAMHTTFSQLKRAGWLMTIGAILFVVSDSLLAVDKFYSALPNAGLIIMFTYGVAQLLITLGAVEYIKSQPDSR
jgi:uncharacterized membrane protein YhhN